MNRWMAVAAVLAACYRPSPEAGSPCSTQGELCPAGLMCVGGLCQPAGTVVDGNSGDASKSGASDAGGSNLDAPPGQTIVLPYGLGSGLLAGTTSLVGTNLDFNTDTGEIDALNGNSTIRAAGSGVIAGIAFELVAQAGAPPIGVFAADSFEVPGTGEWDADGSAAFALVAETIVVDGELWVGGTGNTPGAGGGGGGASGKSGGGCGGGAAGSGQLESATGGGGGGAATAGGDGGGGSGTGGRACGATAEPLVGGGGGGAAASGLGSANGGGGGGGIALLATSSITVDAGGVVEAPGAGGRTADSSGGGGGAGGSLFLVAPAVSLQGALTANGAGGGGADGGAGVDGDDADAMPADGGLGLARGGAGGAGSTAPTAGASFAEMGLAFGGGGGGAYGRIEIRASSVTGGGLASPTAIHSQPTYH